MKKLEVLNVQFPKVGLARKWQDLNFGLSKATEISIFLLLEMVISIRDVWESSPYLHKAQTLHQWSEVDDLC